MIGPRRVCSATFALCALGSAFGMGLAAQEGLLYGFDEDGSGVVRLLEIGFDGTATSIGQVSVTNGQDPHAIEGITFDASGVLWATGDHGGGSNDFLYRFPAAWDNASCTEQQLVLGSHVVGEVNAMCHWFGDEVLIVEAPNGFTRTFDPEDLAAGMTTQPGSPSGDSTAVARFPGQSKVYAVEKGNTLFWFDPTVSASWTLIGVLETSAGVTLGDVNGMAAGSDGYLYGLQLGPGGQTDYVVRIPTTGANGVVTVTRTAVTGFSINSISGLAWFNPCFDPTNAVATPAAVCPNGTSVLTAEASPGDVVDWYTGSCGGTWIGTGDPQNNHALSVVVAATTTFYARASNGPCESSGCAQVTVSVHALPPDPTSAFASDTDVCSQTMVTLGADAPGVLVDWYIDDCDGAWIGEGDEMNGHSLDVVPQATTSYHARARDPVTGCISKDCAFVVVVVNDPPAEPTISASETAVCPGDSTTLSASVAGAVIEWFEDDCNGTPDAVGDTFDVTPSDTTTYFARARDVVTDCVSTCDSITVSVLGAPNIQVQPHGQGFCEYGAVSLTVQADVVEPATYQWRRNGLNLSDGAGVSGAASSTLTIDPAMAADAAMYDVVIHGACGGEATSDAAELFVGQRRVTVYSADSPIQGMTTGGEIVTFEGDGLFTGMAMEFWSPDYAGFADTTTFGASPDGKSITVIVPPFAPGCDCGLLQPIHAEVRIDNGCRPHPVPTGLYFQYDIDRVVVAGAAGAQAALAAAIPGQCIFFDKLTTGAPTSYSGPLQLDATHELLTLTGTTALTPPEVIQVIDYANSSPVIRFDGVPSSVCVSNLVFIGGTTGAEIVDGASPLIYSCIFHDNFGNPSLGGGVTIRGDTGDPSATHPAIVDCTIFNNVPDPLPGPGAVAIRAGGIRLEHASASIVRTRVYGNDGSGIYLEDNCPDLLIADCVINGHPDHPFFGVDGTPSESGGGIHWTMGLTPVQPPPLGGTLLRTEIFDNVAAGHGGGIFLDSRVAPSIVGNAVHDNVGSTSSAMGGGLFVASNYPSGPVIRVCENVFYGNRAQVGGAIAMLNKNLCFIERNLVFCNHAVQNDPDGLLPYFAAGIFLTDANPQILHNTIHGNTGVGGGMGTYAQSGGVHAAGPTTNFQTNSNLLSQNSGCEVLIETGWSGVAPINDNLLFDVAGSLVCASGAFGTGNLEGFDPTFLNPVCTPGDPFLAPWQDYYFPLTSPATIPGTDGLFRGAILDEDFAVGACTPWIPRDCNGNGIPDWIDLRVGTSVDADRDGILDECFVPSDSLGTGTGGTTGVGR